MRVHVPHCWFVAFARWVQRLLADSLSLRVVLLVAWDPFVGPAHGHTSPFTLLFLKPCTGCVVIPLLGAFSCIAGHVFTPSVVPLP